MESSIYSPGAGTLPPVLAGRDDLIRDLDLTLVDVATAGRSRAQDVILAGRSGLVTSLLQRAASWTADHAGP